jgi:arabinose-5-phosphate isomerase
MASTGTPAFFLDLSDGLHGDLGCRSPATRLIAVSDSGETVNVLCVLPVIKRIGFPLIVMRGKAGSTLAGAEEILLELSVKEEVCALVHQRQNLINNSK